MSREWIAVCLAAAGMLVTILYTVKAYGKLGQRVENNTCNHAQCRREMLAALNGIAKDIKRLIAGQNRIKGRLQINGSDDDE